MESHLSIEEAAQRTGLTAHTLRYYERVGLIAPVPRAPGGQRRYAAADMAWIESAAPANDQYAHREDAGIRSTAQRR
jgi:DNA-binding transcriptional MerR regulator